MVSDGTVLLYTTLDNNTGIERFLDILARADTEHPPDLWEDFARLVLRASYEATICAAILNSQSTGSNRVFLTLLGGGVFGNRIEWITEAITRALKLYKDCDLGVAIVSYHRSNEAVRQLVERFA